MSKLVTPVQYEDALSELNQLRPLSVNDEVKIILNTPVLNTSPEPNGLPVNGKLLRCNEQGGVLANKSLGYKNYEIKQGFFHEGTETLHIYYAQKVYMILVNIDIAYDLTELHWTDPTYARIYEEFNLVGNDYVDFVGQHIHIKTAGVGDWSSVVYFYGFY